MHPTSRNRVYELQYELQLASLRSHETHMKHIYGIRRMGLIIAGITIAIGAAMVFAGLQGSFNWAVEAPSSVSAKLTNASPGIIFATVGMIIAFVVSLQKPVKYQTGRPDFGEYLGSDGIELGAARIDLGAGSITGVAIETKTPKT